MSLRHTLFTLYLLLVASSSWASQLVRLPEQEVIKQADRIFIGHVTKAVKTSTDARVEIRLTVTPTRVLRGPVEKAPVEMTYTVITPVIRNDKGEIIGSFSPYITGSGDELGVKEGEDWLFLVNGASNQQPANLLRVYPAAETRFHFPAVWEGAHAVTGAASAAKMANEPFPPPHPAAPSGKALKAFANEAELNATLKRYQDDFRRKQEEYRAKLKTSEPNVMIAKEAPTPSSSLQLYGVMDASFEAESVTNTQTAGVDEGGIVKVHGQHLVILRRGRLFTVDIDHMTPIAAVDAFAPGSDPAGAWYDEMLVSGNIIVVVGYSYARGGTEIGLFDIDGAGHITYRATYHMRSNDYYSSRNYASRLIGSKLIFYTPLYLNLWGDPFASFPAVRRWHPNATPAEFKRIAPATRIYRTADDYNPDSGLALHTVTTCDLAQPEMVCEASAVMGPPGRDFYVSAQSVYVWTTGYTRTDKGNRVHSAVFRLPLDGSTPTALKTAGSPVDQFSFLESPDGYLNVLVRAEGQGEGMWAGEHNYGDLALLRVALDTFSDGTDSAPADNYKPLPKAEGYSLQNRYIGNYLLYGAGNGWWKPAKGQQPQYAYAVRWGDNSPAQALPLPHAVDRIEALGNDAVVIGPNDKDLYFTSVRLGSRAAPAHQYVQANATQGETRSQGFFYKPESPNDGYIGLPIRGGGQAGYRQLREESAAVLFLHNQALELSEMGALEAKSAGNGDDGCRASCVDWYGNSRPLFLHKKVFALMGYELVEGHVEKGRIREVRRISFAPRAAKR